MSPVLNPIFSSGLAVLWLMIPVYISNSFATIPKGRGPPMDFGRNWPWDGRRILGSSKTWSGFLFAGFATLPFGLFLAWLILAGSAAVAGRSGPDADGLGRAAAGRAPLVRGGDR